MSNIVLLMVLVSVAGVFIVALLDLMHTQRLIKRTEEIHVLVNAKMSTALAQIEAQKNEINALNELITDLNLRFH